MKRLIFAALTAAAAMTTFAVNLRTELDPGCPLIWYSPDTPEVRFSVADTLGVANCSDVRFYITPDNEHERRLLNVSQKVDIPAGGKKMLSYKLDVPGPGFYTCVICDDETPIYQYNIVYEPENVVSLPDNEPDLREFWDRALEELAVVPGNYKMTEDKAMSGKLRAVYDVEMQSLGGVTIKGKLYLPRKKGKYPALLSFNGYGCLPWGPTADENPEWIQLITGVRGQVFTRDDNPYGQYVCYNVDDPETYYYKGAYMDLVRFIDFIEQLPQTDTDLIFAEGGSQGGGLTLAAVALDKRIVACAPICPFLCDWPDYFRIVPWPGNELRETAHARGITDEQLMRNLSYFDMKNLARWITCPVLFGMGLQDPICPPHTNISSYNLIRAPKTLYIYPNHGHAVDDDHFKAEQECFFNEMIERVCARR